MNNNQISTNRFIKVYKNISQFTTQKVNLFLDKRVSQFIEDYELKFREYPSENRIKKFRKEQMMFFGIVAYVIVAFLFYNAWAIFQ